MRLIAAGGALAAFLVGIPASFATTSEPRAEYLGPTGRTIATVPDQLIVFPDGTEWTAPGRPGTYPLPGRGTAFVVVPAAEAESGFVHGYRVGHYPPARRNTYGFPPGFIQVDPESRHVRVSEHFKLGDFLCKNAGSTSYVLVSGRLVHKLEAIVRGLRERGYQAPGLRLMSAYRTPDYNARIGNKTRWSRHTYGDAADVLADDWNRDGKITGADASILFGVVDRLDRSTDLRGGASVYRPNGQHSWFVHTDARGVIARW